MKILSKQEFLLLSVPTLYCDYNGSMDCGALSIKYQTQHGNDWVYKQLFDVNFLNTGEFMDLMLKAESDSSFELPMNTESTQSDAMYQSDDRFLVFSPDEVKQLIVSLQELV